MPQRRRKSNISKVFTTYIKARLGTDLTHKANHAYGKITLSTSVSQGNASGVSRFFDDLEEKEIYPPIFRYVLKGYMPAVDSMMALIPAERFKDEEAKLKKIMGTNYHTMVIPNVLMSYQDADDTDISSDIYEEVDLWLAKLHAMVHAYLFDKTGNELRAPLKRAFGQEGLKALYETIPNKTGMDKQTINRLLVAGYLLAVIMTAQGKLQEVIAQKNDEQQMIYQLSNQILKRTVDKPLFALKDLRKALIAAVNNNNVANIKGTKEEESNLTVWGLIKTVNRTITDYQSQLAEGPFAKNNTLNACKLFKQHVIETKRNLELKETLVGRIVRGISDGIKRAVRGVTGKSVQLSTIATLSDLEAKANKFLLITESQNHTYGVIQSIAPQVEETQTQETQQRQNERLAELLGVNLDEKSVDDYLGEKNSQELMDVYTKLTTEEKNECKDLLPEFAQRTNFPQAKKVVRDFLQDLEMVLSVQEHADNSLEKPATLEQVAVEHNFGANEVVRVPQDKESSAYTLTVK
jgi:hypothetical protein